MYVQADRPVKELYSIPLYICKVDLKGQSNKKNAWVLYFKFGENNIIRRYDNKYIGCISFSIVLCILY